MIIDDETPWGNDLPEYLCEAIAEYGNAMCTVGNDLQDDFDLNVTRTLDARADLEDAIKHYKHGEIL